MAAFAAVLKSSRGHAAHLYIAFVDIRSVSASLHRLSKFQSLASVSFSYNNINSLQDVSEFLKQSIITSAGNITKQITPFHRRLGHSSIRQFRYDISYIFRLYGVPSLSDPSEHTKWPRT